MSYLQFPRLAFAGSFQADVSTVNNDPRHYDIDNFEPAFQDFQTKQSYNGWWHPTGTASCVSPTARSPACAGRTAC